MYAVDATTGILKWKYKTDASLSPPTIAGGVIYVGSDDKAQ